MAGRGRESERAPEEREDRQVDERDVLLMLVGIDALYGEADELSPGLHADTTQDTANPW